MDYNRIYNLLIEDAQKNPKNGYIENHHIIPKCMGGSDKKTNSVKLSARQHFLAHWLLYKMYPTTKMSHAWHCMSRIGSGQEERRQNSRLFHYAKEARRKRLSESSFGINNHFYGKKHTEETKRKISEKTKGLKLSEERKMRFTRDVAKQPRSVEHRRKIGRKGLIMLQNKETLEIVRVLKSDPTYDRLLWVSPKLIKPDRQSECIHCKKMMTGTNLSRWHGDKCKQRKTDESEINSSSRTPESI